jgi:hypothetical protein
MKQTVFLLLLVYASSILNVSELYAQKVNVAWYNETTEKEKKEIKDYTHSVGIAVGSSFGLAYKYFFKDNWALKVDITDNAFKGHWDAYTIFTNFDFNPNVVYQIPIKTFKTCRLDFFAGGGTTLGFGDLYLSSYCEYYDYDEIFLHNCVGDYHWDIDRYSTGMPFIWGLNGILGLELNLAIPMTIEFDFRPGYGLFSFYEWGECDGRHYDYPEYVYCDFTVPAHRINESFFDWSVNVTISYKF